MAFIGNTEMCCCTLANSSSKEYNSNGGDKAAESNDLAEKSNLDLMWKWENSTKKNQQNNNGQNAEANKSILTHKSIRISDGKEEISQELESNEDEHKNVLGDNSSAVDAISTGPAFPIVHHKFSERMEMKLDGKERAEHDQKSSDLIKHRNGDEKDALVHRKNAAMEKEYPESFGVKNNADYEYISDEDDRSTYEGYVLNKNGKSNDINLENNANTDRNSIIDGVEQQDDDGEEAKANNDMGEKHSKTIQEVSSTNTNVNNNSSKEFWNDFLYHVASAQNKNGYNGSIRSSKIKGDSAKLINGVHKASKQKTEMDNERYYTQRQAQPELDIDDVKVVRFKEKMKL